MREIILEMQKCLYCQKGPKQTVIFYSFILLGKQTGQIDKEPARKKQKTYLVYLNKLENRILTHQCGQLINTENGIEKNSECSKF